MPDARPLRLTDDEIRTLRSMALDYERAKWVRGKAKIWLTWLLGLPVLVLGAWKAIEQLWHAFSGAAK